MFAFQSKFQIQYFDRNILKHKWAAWNKNPLEKAGNLVRKIARGSIKRIGQRKNSPFLHTSNRYSKKGHPPFSRQPGAVPPFKMIYSVPQKLGTSVIVGMVGFNTKANPIPGLHEDGGMVTRTVFVKAPGQKRRRAGKHLSFPHLIPVKKVIIYPERPFMKPALKKASILLPNLWKDSIR